VIMAQSELGNLYVSGEGVTQDYAEAYFWLSLASAAETNSAKRDDLARQRDEACSHLTESARAETLQRLRKWTDAHAPKTSP